MMHPRANPILHVKEGDTRPTLEWQLTDNDDNPIDLTPVDEVRFYMQHDSTGDLIVNGAVTVEDRKEGRVSYQFDEHETARRGRHLSEFVLYYDDGGKRTSPSSTFLAIDVHEPTDREVDPGDYGGREISVSRVRVDEISTYSEAEITVLDRVQFDDGIGVGGLDVSDDGTVATLDYGADGTLTIDEDGVSVPAAPDIDSHVARAIDIREMGHESWDVLNAADHGFPGDLSGGDIAQLINDNPDKTILLPGGRYSLESPLSFDETSARDSVRVIGKPHATIVVNDTAVEEFAQLGTSGGAGFSECHLENLSLEVDPANGYDAGWGRYWINDRFVTKNLQIKGERDRINEGGGKYGLLTNMVEKDAVGIHQGLRFADGENHDTSLTQFDHTIGVSAEDTHVGTNIWLGCHVAKWGDNGFYVKDGSGANLLLGCTAANCGGANIRLGRNDTAISCESLWDSTDDLIDGVCFDSDDGGGTAAIGARIIRETGSNDCVRLRSGSEQATYQDFYIENNTSQYSLRVSSTDGAHEDGIISLEGIRVVDSGDTSTRAASVLLHRPNVHVRDMSVDVTDGTTSRTALQIHGDSTRISDSRFVAAGPNYSVILGESSGGNTITMASLEGCLLSDGFHIYDNDDVIERLKVVNSDLRNVTDLFPSMTDVNKAVFSEVDGITLDDVPDGMVVDGSVMESGTTGTPTGSYDPGRWVRTDGWYLTNPDGSFDGPL